MQNQVWNAITHSSLKGNKTHIYIVEMFIEISSKTIIATWIFKKFSLLSILGIHFF